VQCITAKEAKTHFGELIDTVQREPVSIKKYGRSVAVMMSSEEYRQFKLERLRVRLSMGEVQLDRGQGVDRRTFFKELTRTKTR
jgi:prevent-host-death family protein